MSDVTSLAFDLLVSQHTTDVNRQAQLDEMVKLQLENSRLKAEQRAANPPKAKVGARPIHGAPTLKGIMRSPTVETATAFLVASRRSRSRGESIAAIEAFIGYDMTGDFGAQDTRARSLAQVTVRPVSTQGPTREEERSAANSMKGFVSGLPDHTARTLANLRAQAAKHAEALIEATKQGDTVAATVEYERLNGEAGIYAQIKTLGFDH
jgi:hypothetical protein